MDGSPLIGAIFFMVRSGGYLKSPRRIAMKNPTPPVTGSARHITGETLRSRKVLSVQEAALLCNVSMSFLIKARISGGGPRYVKFSPSPRGRIGYQLDDLERWLESRKRQHTSELI